MPVLQEQKPVTQKILINRGAHKFFVVKANAGLWFYNPDIPGRKYFQETVLRV